MLNDRFKAASLNTRIITGAVLASILIAAWLLGGMAVFCLALVVSIFAQWEFYSLFYPGKQCVVGKISGIALGCAYMAAFFFDMQFLTPASALPLILLLFAISSLFFFSHDAAPANMKRAAILVCGFLYVPFLLSPIIGFSPIQQLFVVLIPVLSDIAAYFVGVCFGKHKIWVAVSPKKSVEGAAGGLGAALIATIVGGMIASPLTIGQLFIAGILLGVMAQLGDFFESALKRSVNIKDSGFILPGHGGMLDRIDSLLFTVGTFSILSIIYSLNAAGAAL